MLKARNLSKMFLIAPFAKWCLFASLFALICSPLSGWYLLPVTREGKPDQSDLNKPNKMQEGSSAHVTNVSFNAQNWNEYRIGDGIAMHHGAPGCDAFPDSIVCAYLRITDVPNNISALVEVLEKRSKARTESSVALLHARLGDGLCAVVDEPCRGTRSGVPDCWNNDEDCWFDAEISRQYAYSKHWYTSVVSQLRQLRITSVRIVGDKFHWTRTPDPRQGNFSVDEAYMDAVVHFFRTRGFGVHIQEPQLPDSDFLFLCSAQVFVQGGGGYSALVARVVENRGGKVIIPAKYSW